MSEIHRIWPGRSVGTGNGRVGALRNGTVEALSATQVGQIIRPNGSALASGITAAVGMAGFCSLLGGTATLAWVYGIDYAARRLDDLEDDR